MRARGLTFSAVYPNDSSQHDRSIGGHDFDFVSFEVVNRERRIHAIRLQGLKIRRGNVGGPERDLSRPFTSRLYSQDWHERWSRDSY